MNKNDFINLKFFSSIYLKLKNKKVSSLEVKAKILKKEIEREKKLFEQNNQYFNKLLEDNTLIKIEYSNLLKLFENENKTLSIRNNNYNVAVCENVFIKKKSSYYVIQTKREDENIYTFDKNMDDFIDYFLTLEYSIIVLSVSKNRIILQFRLLKVIT